MTARETEPCATPRTNAFLDVPHVAHDAMWYEFACRLERELAEARKDTARLAWLADLIKNCPTASFHWNDDPDVEFPDGSSMPVGFTIRIGACHLGDDDEQVTAPTFPVAIDQMRKLIVLPVQQARP